MSSFGELYITEDCAYEFRSELDQEFGKNAWYLDGDNGYESAGEFPKYLIVDVLDKEEDAVIGKIGITSKHFLEEDEYSGEQVVEVEPVKIEILSNKNKQ